MKNLVLLLAKWVAGFRLQPQEQAKCETRNPTRSFNRYPGQNFPRFLFTVHARSLEQARASLVAAKRIAGETIVVGPVSLDGASQ